MAVELRGATSALPPLRSTGAVGGDLSHVDQYGRARIVDITAKEPSQRRAVAGCRIDLTRRGAELMRDRLEGTRILDAARITGVMAGKDTFRLVPLCHQILIDNLVVECTLDGSSVEVRVTAESFERTGLEMEALTACTFAALALVAELGQAGHEAVIEGLVVLEKSGGRSGDWRRSS